MTTMETQEISLKKLSSEDGGMNEDQWRQDEGVLKN